MPEWEQVREILALALEQNPEARSRFIRDACAGDTELLAEVESLAQHCQDADSLLENSPAAALFPFAADPMVDRCVGSWRILRRIGQGGMAVVYLAERDGEDFRKSVAIKMVRPGPNTDEIYRRFRNERKTLAALEHPNIVRLLDGGATEEGLPYLVMDYVDGLPVDLYCDQKQLSIEDRLILFRSICSAVQYAHDHHVIHRDLKPANILVTQGGIPRLLDFGIAKLLDPELYQTALVTRTVVRPMTPEYASPEQVRGQAIAPASDVYALGVLLYELLTGHRPYRCGESFLELERAICEDEVEKPSTAVTRTKLSSPSDTVSTITPNLVSRARGLAPSELRRRLHGDLDAIVMKALRKEPQNRYVSAAAFANDIERFQAGMRVSARQPTVSYRGARFLRRHRESAVAVAIALTIIPGLIAWEEHRASKRMVSQSAPSGVQIRVRPALAILGFDNLSGRADIAWVSTALSEAMATELTAGEELRIVPGETVALTKVDMGLSNVEGLAPELLDRIRRNLGSDFVILGSYFDSGKAGAEQIRLDLRLENSATKDTIATVTEMGGEGQLLDLVTRSGSRLRERLGLSPISTLERQAIQASIASNPAALQLYSQGLVKLRAFDPLAARDLLVRAVASDPSYPLAHAALSRAWQDLGYSANAQQEAKRALDLAGKLSREEVLLLQARSYEASMDWTKAIETYKALLNTFPDSVDYGIGLARTQTSGGKGEDALKTLSGLARVNAYAGDDPSVDLGEANAAASMGDDRLRRDAADRAATKATQLGARLLEARARTTECRALANLGEIDRAKATCDEAKRIFADAGDKGGLARALHSAAEIPLDQGDYVSAEKLYRQSLAIVEQIGDKKSMGSEFGNLGVVYVRLGDFARGQRMYAEALRNYKQAGDKNGIVVATGNMGNLLRAEGRLPQALVDYETVLKLSTDLGHKGSVALCLQAIGEVKAEQGHLADALTNLQQALSIQLQIGAKSNYASTLDSAGEVFRQQGELEKAADSEQQALTVQQQLGERGSAAESRLALAEAAHDAGKAAEAETLVRAALKEFQAEKEPVQEIAAEGLLARISLDRNKIGDAKECIDRAIKLSKTTPDEVRRLLLLVDNAYVLAAQKRMDAAESAGRQAMTEALRLGLIRTYFEASLATGKIELQMQSKAAGQARLQKLAKDAQSKGFVLIARGASASLSGST